MLKKDISFWHMRLDKKNIIVTAAAQGIGRATALKFAKEGAKVLATDINEDKLNDLKNKNKSIQTMKLDATNKNDVAIFCSSIDKIDVLFHAVGFVHHGTILDCDENEFSRSINVNIFSAYLMTYNLLPKMLKEKKGNIVIVSSACANLPIACLAIKSDLALTGSSDILTLPSQEGVSTVPGKIALQRIPSFTWSMAIAFTNPFKAALVVPYINLFGAPLTFEAADDTITILPFFCFNIFGRRLYVIK